MEIVQIHNNRFRRTGKNRWVTKWRFRGVFGEFLVFLPCFWPFCGHFWQNVHSLPTVDLNPGNRRHADASFLTVPPSFRIIVRPFLPSPFKSACGSHRRRQGDCRPQIEPRGSMTPSVSSMVHQGIVACLRVQPLRVGRRRDRPGCSGVGQKVAKLPFRQRWPVSACGSAAL